MNTARPPERNEEEKRWMMDSILDQPPTFEVQFSGRTFVVVLLGPDDVVARCSEKEMAEEIADLLNTKYRQWRKAKP